HPSQRFREKERECVCVYSSSDFSLQMCSTPPWAALMGMGVVPHLLLASTLMVVVAQAEQQRPAASFESYDVFQEATSTVQGSADQSKQLEPMSAEFAVCKATVGSTCANSRLHCPTACVQGFYGGGSGRGYGGGLCLLLRLPQWLQSCLPHQLSSQ
ncbi:hypothetical protein GOP47_0009033, partial [Adiantum capillus-veneris]